MEGMPFVEDGEEDSDDEEDYDGGGRADQVVVHDEVSATVRLRGPRWIISKSFISFIINFSD